MARRNPARPGRARRGAWAAARATPEKPPWRTDSNSCSDAVLVVSVTACCGPPPASQQKRPPSSSPNGGARGHETRPAGHLAAAPEGTGLDAGPAPTTRRPGREEIPNRSPDHRSECRSRSISATMCPTPHRKQHSDCNADCSRSCGHSPAGGLSRLPLLGATRFAPWPSPHRSTY